MAKDEKDYDEAVLQQLRSKLVATAGTKGSREQWGLKEFIEKFNDDWKKTPLESFAEKLGKSNVERLLKWDKLADKITVTRDQGSGQYTIVAKVTQKNEVTMQLINGTIAAKEAERRTSKNVKSDWRMRGMELERGGANKVLWRYQDARQAAPVRYNRSFRAQRPYPGQFTQMPIHVPRQMSFHYESRVAHRPQVYPGPNAFLTGGNTASMGARAATYPQRPVPAEFRKSSAAGIQRSSPPTYAQMAAAVPVEFSKSAPNIQVPPPGRRYFVTASPPPGFQHRQLDAFIRRTMPNAAPPSYPPDYPPGFTQQRFNGVSAGEFPIDAVSSDTKRRATEQLRQAVKTRVEGTELQATPKSTETLVAPQVQREGEGRALETRCNTDFNSEENDDVLWVPKQQYSSIDEFYADIAKVTARFEKVKLEAKDSETSSDLPPRLTDVR